MQKIRIDIKEISLTGKPYYATNPRGTKAGYDEKLGIPTLGDDPVTQKEMLRYQTEFNKALGLARDLIVTGVIDKNTPWPGSGKEPAILKNKILEEPKQIPSKT